MVWHLYRAIFTDLNTNGYCLIVSRFISQTSSGLSPAQLLQSKPLSLNRADYCLPSKVLICGCSSCNRSDRRKRVKFQAWRLRARHVVQSYCREEVRIRTLVPLHHRQESCKNGTGFPDKVEYKNENNPNNTLHVSCVISNYCEGTSSPWHLANSNHTWLLWS